MGLDDMAREGLRAPPVRPAVPVNALSFDVEDYFQVQALEGVFSRSDWPAIAPRVEQNTARILDILSERGVRATFFTLGWVAQRHPGLVRRILAEGHELASHGLAHHRVDRQQPEEFRADVRATKRLLEDVGGRPVIGYRAATFSVGPRQAWAFRVLEEEGYLYSSSVYPITSDNYAFPDAPRFSFRPKGTERLWEHPIATIRALGRNWPAGGGGYFRLLPYAVSRRAIARINAREGRPAVFYLHPWEFDPAQPRPAGVPLKSRLRHYLNLSRTAGRLARLVRDLPWDRLDRVFAHAAG